MRVLITLACEECKMRNYITDKNKTKTPERFTKKKYCRRCNTRTSHRETK